jgi:hypothetical protein
MNRHRAGRSARAEQENGGSDGKAESHRPDSSWMLMEAQSRLERASPGFVSRARNILPRAANQPSDDS